jgi:ribosomal protein S12 methylthiotransferase accessory factor
MDMKIGFPGGLRVNAELKNFVIESDQPSRAGGGESAPAPFDLFLASIGTCVGFYVLKFCNQRNLSTNGIALSMSTVKDPRRGMVSQVTFKLVLPKSFPEKYETAIVRAMDLCSVKRHIAEPPSFRTIVEHEARMAPRAAS